MTRSRSMPPRLAEWINACLLAPAERAAVLGDLAEEFSLVARDRGAAAARQWYWRQTRASLLPNLKRRLPSPSPRSSLMTSLLQDIRFSWRSLRSRPLTTAVAVISLTVGLASSTVVFSLLDAAVLRPLPIAQPDEVVLLLEERERGQNHNFRYSDYTNFRPTLAAEMDLVALDRADATIQFGGQSQRVKGEIVTGSYFTTFGVRARQGRVLTIADDDRSSGPVVVVSESLWARAFGADTRLTDQTLMMNNTAFSVVGVAAAPFRGMQLGRNAEFWAPLRYQVVLFPAGGRDFLASATVSWLTLLARLQPGVSVQSAAARLNQAESRLPRPQNRPARRFILVPGAQGDSPLPSSTASPLQMLLAAAGLVMVIACANVTNLLLTRAADRTRELSLRAALGAGRARLARLLVTEAFLLSMTATALALLIANWITALAVPFLSTFGEVPVLDVSLNVRVFAFGAALAVAVTLVLGLVPALMLAPGTLSRSMADGGRSASVSPGRARLRRGLVALQFALSLGLVVSSTLLMRTVFNLQSIAPGFAIDRLAVLESDGESAGLKDERLRQYNDAAVARLGAMPGVVSVAIARVQPIDFGGWRTSITVPGYSASADEDMEINFNIVSAGYFDTMGIAVKQGRAFNDGDREGRPAVAVVNETMARRFWKDRPAIGNRIALSDTDFAEVVGVVADAKYRMLREEAGPSFYLAREQNPPRPGVFHVRTAGRPEMLLPALRKALAEVDTNVPVTRVRSLREQALINVTDERLAMTIAVALGAAAVLLATVGLFGAMSATVAQRLREIGVRIALGADPRSIRALVIRQGLSLAVVGTVLGLGLAVWSGRLIEAKLFGVKAGDPLSFAVSAALLAALALLATWIPARRATRVDPVDVLRAD
jgi:predicted permease